MYSTPPAPPIAAPVCEKPMCDDDEMADLLKDCIGVAPSEADYRICKRPAHNSACLKRPAGSSACLKRPASAAPCASPAVSPPAPASPPPSKAPKRACETPTKPAYPSHLSEWLSYDSGSPWATNKKRVHSRAWHSARSARQVAGHNEGDCKLYAQRFARSVVAEFVRLVPLTYLDKSSGCACLHIVICISICAGFVAWGR